MPNLRSGLKKNIRIKNNTASLNLRKKYIISKQNLCHANAERWNPRAGVAVEKSHLKMRHGRARGANLQVCSSARGQTSAASKKGSNPPAQSIRFDSPVCRWVNEKSPARSVRQ